MRAAYFWPVYGAPNPYFDLECSFRYYFVRKPMFVTYLCAFLFFPGDFGTINEALEALTLVQAHKILHFPVPLFGGDFWSGLERQLDALEERAMVDAEDRWTIHRVEHPDEAVAVLGHFHAGFGAELHKPPLRRR